MTTLDEPTQITLKPECVVQLCVDCWRTREGGGENYPDRIRSDTREESYCGVCGEVTDFGVYRVYAGASVHVVVPARVVGGPRDGWQTRIRLSAAHVVLSRWAVERGEDLYRVEQVGLDIRLIYEGPL